MKKRRWTGILAALALIVSLVPAAGALGMESDNLGAHEYVNGRRWAQPVKSYLYENPQGGLTRVEYIDGWVYHEDYDSKFGLLEEKSVGIKGELPIWGGFFAGEDYNYLIYGQNNEEEDDKKEVIRIVQYDKDWNRLKQASLFGGNTVEPFEAGSLRCDEYNGYLYIRTCHKMYTSDDGLNHQANVMLVVRQKDMKITDSFYLVEWGVGYVSHSFNQFVLIDQEGRIVALDHGDAYPRELTLQRYIQKAGQDSFRAKQYTDGCTAAAVLELPTAASHYNDTGCALGGFAETSKGYVTAYQFDGTASELGEDSRDLYLAFTGKDMGKSSAVRLTTGKNVSNPQLACAGLEGGYVLWNTIDQKNWYTSTMGDTLYYVSYDANGKTGEIKTAKASLSDCVPIFWNGKAVWYTTNGSGPVFYTLDSSGVTAHEVTSSQVPPASEAMAQASTQFVSVDGERVEFQAYALLDEEGNPTNYVKLRDLAYVLNGTPAQFQVGWDGGVVLTSKTPYTVSGGEMTTPYSGNQPYTVVEDAATVDGKSVKLDAFAIYDSQGGGYTYYKLRDLGETLGFAVDWSQEQGIMIHTR